MGPVLERAFAALGTVLARAVQQRGEPRVFQNTLASPLQHLRLELPRAALHRFLGARRAGDFVGLPLLSRFMTRRRVAVFLSFNRTREDAAKGLQNSLKSQGVNVTRIPYKDGAPHQEIVQAVSQGIRECNALLCVPGGGATFVDSEVMAAGAGGKAVIFLLSESDGTLPNTADKRYPVFKLEESEPTSSSRSSASSATSAQTSPRSSTCSRALYGARGGSCFESRRGYLLLTLTLGR